MEHACGVKCQVAKPVAASTDRSDGKIDREPRSDENERGIALERVKVIAGKSSKSQAPTFRKIPNYPLGFGAWPMALKKFECET